MSSPLLRVALRCDLLASNNCVKAEPYCLPETMDHLKLENEQLKLSILEKNTAMKAMSTCLFARE